MRMGELASVHAELVQRLDKLEKRTEAPVSSYDTFTRNTRVKLKQVFNSRRKLMTQTISTWPTDFVTDNTAKKGRPKSKGR